MASTTEKKEALIEQLRLQSVEENKLGDSAKIDENFIVDSACCARYLRARNWNLSKAKKMLQDTIDWRRTLSVGSIVEDQFPVIEKEAATGKTFVLPDRDREGHVIVVMRSKLENTHSHQGNVLHLVYQMERAVKATNLTPHEKWILLIDFDGYSIRNAPPMKTSKATLGAMQNHYPERLAKAILVNAPFLFFATFKALSPFIDPVTKEKILFIRGDEAHRKQQLSTFIAPESLEKCLGGTSDFVYDASTYLAQDKIIYDKAHNESPAEQAADISSSS